MENLSNFLSLIQENLGKNTFVKINLGNYRGLETDLKNIYCKPVIIKKQAKISFTFRYKTKDIVKNYTTEEALSLIEKMVQLDGFRHAVLFTLDFDLTLNYNKKWELDKKIQANAQPSLEHDRQKNRKIETDGKKYLELLRITDSEGNVYKTTQDKYKQINHYIELLSSLLKELPAREQTNIVDMGSGKGYLTFALYDYLTNTLQKNVKITGVEFRKELVDLCNEIAEKSNFNNLSFEQNVIENYDNKDINVLIALHACDTATDDAICKGITNQADLIVVAPCCHKQIRREIEKNNVENNLDFLTKYGVFLERQAEMVTDGIRALILEYYGYSTKVFEFVSDAHTPKNVLIVGLKKQNVATDQESILNKIKSTKAFFGIDYHHLEKIMGIK